VCVCMCVIPGRKKGTKREPCTCLYVREIEKEKKCTCVCVRERERERESQR
jgi:hypothetical protein